VTGAEAVVPGYILMAFAIFGDIGPGVGGRAPAIFPSGRQ
jgi:hypothetical protein